MNPVLSINTLAYEGYDLTTALQEIAKIGVSHVELGYTRGWTEGLTEEHFSEASAANTNRLLSDLGLSSIALSAHIDLTTEAAVDELKRRIDFGKRLGARIVNTKVGARSGLKKFEKNIEPIAEYAESVNIVIGLENPSEGTDQIITSGKTGAEEKQVDVRVNLMPDLPLAQGDPDRLVQVIANLISNAIKFSPQGATVGIRTRIAERQILVEVVDTGPGIPEEEMHLLFQEFARLSNKPTGNEKSSGVGLAIVRKSANRLGWSVRVEGKPDAGATFRVDIN